MTVPHLSFVKAISKTFLFDVDQILNVFPKSYVSQLEFHLIYFSKSNKILESVMLACLVQIRPPTPKYNILFHYKGSCQCIVLDNIDYNLEMGK